MLSNFQGMNWSPFFGLVLFMAHPSVAAQTTFHADVAPIIYTHCTQCHRQGEIGPMPFTTFDEVSAYGNFIVYVTASGYMPPWTPDHNYSSLRGERFLTEEEKAVLAEWVESGMPEGDPADNPGLPSFPEDSQIGEPDLVLSMPEPFVHQGNMMDQYQVFVIPTGVTESTEVQAIEVRPGNNAVDHHALIAYTNNPSAISQAQSLDAADPAPGYESFGDYGVDVDEFLFGGWVPGTPPIEFPATIGHVMDPGSHLLLQMHYGPSPIEEVDQTEINIFFADAPIQREVETMIVGPQFLDTPFIIPPDQITTFHASVEIDEDVSLVSITPHCHLLGKSWEVFARSADALDTIPLISIPNWDFNWQGLFTFPQLVHIPGGYVVEAFCTYDNTSDNPMNPSDPPEWMSWGDFTTDEMYVLFLQGVPYMEGDEDISMSVPDRNTMMTYVRDNLYPAWPNPATSDQIVQVGFHLSQAGETMLSLHDLHGRELRRFLDGESRGQGYHLESMEVAGLPSGTYVYRLVTPSGEVRAGQLQLIAP